MVEHKRAIRRKKQQNDEEQLSTSKQHKKHQLSTDTSQFQHQDLTSHNILHLQRTIGNAAVQRLIIQREEVYPDSPASAPSDPESIEAYLNFGPTKKVLSNFAAKTDLSEMLDCLESISLYETHPTAQLARQIYNLFVSEQAAFEINLGNDIRLVVREKISNLDKGEIPADLFKQAKKNLMKDFRDPFLRAKKEVPEWKKAYKAFLKFKKPGLGNQITGFLGGLFSKKKH